ncbi:predicted protein [Histoplasma capsulatum G186AR]|uniref:F-box domain-containing protein n=2 Tax=Ajellomyces capsulatus TaxID=5037 RepID=C0P1A3_AJECG|nr:uncharacterized protein HCBG_09183 [Histoplasma capsulatum G186AR]EEH02618.1 predicted protein [Histoplasma capsulatum G186AR]KAG5296114.1 hypothetical protein I7I52_06651 [Histoplasma capsulatum]QSS74095.1 hypothetical protein I7I50_09132 [Histoplasma capsulatum G186AR]
METLSVEIVIKILENLSKETLKVVRLTSKELSALASPLLFNRVYASSHLHDLEVLSSISRHPVLSLHVREIVFCGMFFHSSGIKTNNKSIPEDDLENGRQYYKSRLDEQNETLSSKEDLVIISTALARMPNIQMVVLTNHWLPTRDLLNHCDYETRVYGPEGQYGEGPYGDARSGGPLSRCYPRFAEKPDGWQQFIPGKISKYIRIDHGFTVMCQALSIAQVPVQMLSIDYSDPVMMDTAAIPGIYVGSFCVTLRMLNHFINAFRHLRKMSFSLFLYGFDHDCDMSDDMDNHTDEWLALMEGNVAKVFTAATDLEELAIDFTDKMHRITLNNFWGDHTWHRLRSLKLFRKRMYQNEMVELIRRHCKTLEVLHLYSIVIHGGGWPEVADVMRECVALRSLSFGRLGERVDHNNVKPVIIENLEEYVLRGGLGPIYDPDYRPQTPICASLD